MARLPWRTGLRVMIADRVRAAGGGSLSLTFVTSGTSTSASIAIPASAQAGDLAVVFDGSFNTNSASITAVTPYGWTTVVNDYSGYGGDDGARLKVNRKVLVSGDLSTSPTFSTSTTNRKMILIFRPSKAIASVTASSWNSELTSSDPSQQTVSASGQTAPLIVMAWASANSASAPAFTDSPALTEVAMSQSDWSIRVGYTVYNTGPQNHTIDVGDNGQNGLQSGYLSLT